MKENYNDMDRAELERRLAETEALLDFFKASADAMPNPIFIKDDELRFVFFNKAYRDFFDLHDDSYIGKKVFDLEYISENDRLRFQSEDQTILNEQSSLQYETVFMNVDGLPADSLYWSRGFQVSGTGKKGIVGEIVDISDEKHLQRELRRSMSALEILMQNARDASKTDPVTHLHNRNVLIEEVPELIKNSVASNIPISIMIMDIDNFKHVNDTYGHPYGDEILRSFAAVLTSSLRQGDIAIRYGGDEFIVLLPGADISQAGIIAERLCRTIRSEVSLPDGKNVTTSIGFTCHRTDEELMSFISRADEALYEAKRAGRNRTVAKEA